LVLIKHLRLLSHEKYKHVLDYFCSLEWGAKWKSARKINERQKDLRFDPRPGYWVYSQQKISPSIRVGPSPSSQTVRSLLRTPSASKPAEKNDLSIAPILLIFYIFGNVFLVD
jgi:hypothetical protein